MVAERIRRYFSDGWITTGKDDNSLSPLPLPPKSYPDEDRDQEPVTDQEKLWLKVEKAERADKKIMWKKSLRLA